MTLTSALTSACKAVISASGLTQREIAERMGVTETSICRWNKNGWTVKAADKLWPAADASLPVLIAELLRAISTA